VLVNLGIGVYVGHLCPPLSLLDRIVRVAQFTAFTGAAGVAAAVDGLASRFRNIE
jgi:hypothetical protein